MAPFTVKLNIYLAKGSVKLKRNKSDRSFREAAGLAAVPHQQCEPADCDKVHKLQWCLASCQHSEYNDWAPLLLQISQKISLGARSN